MALRTIPVVLDLCRDIAAEAPDALLINLTNPSSIVQYAITRYVPDIRVISLCDLPMMAHTMAAKALNVPESELAFRYTGMNHFGWVTGVRRDQSPSRAATPKLGWDDRNGLWKASPLADWTDDDVWAYVHERDLPVNPLHERGYASIGCTHCTAPGTGREGRWLGTGKTECGLHA